MGHIFLFHPIPRQFMPVPSHLIPRDFHYIINMEYSLIKIIEFIKVYVFSYSVPLLKFLLPIIWGGEKNFFWYEHVYLYGYQIF